VTIAIHPLELGNRAAAPPPFMQRDLGILIGVDRSKPGRELPGQVIATVNERGLGFLPAAGASDEAGRPVIIGRSSPTVTASAVLGSDVLMARPVIRLVFLQIHQAVGVTVPAAKVCSQVLGHFVWA